MVEINTVISKHKKMLQLIIASSVAFLIVACGTFGERGGASGTIVEGCSGLEQVGISSNSTFEEIRQVEAFGYEECARCLSDNYSSQQICF